MLAALRAITPIYHPPSFAAAVQLEMFHRCVQQALALLPTRTPAAGDGRSWSEFLHAYRTVGLAQGMHDVNAADDGMLTRLYEQHSDGCWEVLSRVSRAAQPVNLTPLYLKRAIVNNERAATAALLRPSTLVSETDPGGAIGHPPQMVAVDDPRVVLLRSEGINPLILTDAMSLAYLQAWVAEANARRVLIKRRVGWLIWGIESGYMPDEHPKLPKLPSSEGAPVGEGPAVSRSIHAPGSDVSARDSTAGELHATWQAVLDVLQQRVAPIEFVTWLQETQLEHVDRDDHTAVISTSNIFGREQLEQTYLVPIEAALASQLGVPLRVQVVIAAPC